MNERIDKSNSIKKVAPYKVPKEYAIANDRASLALFGKDRPQTKAGEIRTIQQAYKTGKKGKEAGQMTLALDFTPEYMAKRPQRPERGLTREQKSVLDGIMTCMADPQFKNDDGHWIVPIQAVIRVLRGTDRASATKSGETIQKDIAGIAWDLSNAYIDMNVKKDVGMDQVELGKRARLINLSLLRVRVNGQEAHALEIYDSIVYRYAQAKNQILRFSRDTVAIKSVNLNLQNIAIRDYILQHLACKTQYARYISFDDMYYSMGLYTDELSAEAYRQRTKRCRTTAFKILDGYVSKGDLAGYERKIKGKKILGVIPSEWHNNKKKGIPLTAVAGVEPAQYEL